MRLRRLVLLCLAALLMAGTGQALAKETVKLAFIGPLSGGNSAIGLGGRNSAELAIKLKNADPSAKYAYEFISLDDECKSNIGVQVATKIAADKSVTGAVAHYCSVAALATVDVFHKFGMPIVVWGAVHPQITYGNDYPEINRVNGTMIDPNKAAAKFMTGQGFKTWAILHDTTDYGKGHMEYITKFLEKDGGKVVGTFPVMPDQQDFTAELTQIATLKPDVIYFGGLTPLGVRIRLQMDKLGIPAVFQGVSGIVSDAYFEGVGPASEGTIAFREGGPIEKLPGGKAFTENYAKAGYAEPADAYGPFAYSGMTLLIDAVEKVGPNRAKVTDYLRGVKDADTIVGKVTFDDHGQNTNPVVTGFVVQDKKWVPWDDSEYASGKRKLGK
jgi:branched-chain amino acid transport system substrate-binding protein